MIMTSDLKGKMDMPPLIMFMFFLCIWRYLHLLLDSDPTSISFLLNFFLENFSSHTEGLFFMKKCFWFHWRDLISSIQKASQQESHEPWSCSFTYIAVPCFPSFICRPIRSSPVLFLGLCLLMIVNWGINQRDFVIIKIYNHHYITYLSGVKITIQF